jgi:hypothetical protein
VLVTGRSPANPHATKSVFLNITQTLWSGEKLSGVHDWPYKFCLPAECAADTQYDDTTDKWPLPPSFMEQESSFTIHYELFLHIRRSKLRGDSRFHVLFAF